MARSANRLNVTLDDEQWLKLQRLAERTRVNEGTIARSLLSSALDDADPDARSVTALLDGIPGALARAHAGAAEAARGKVVPLDAL
ncbi:MAG: hypothetical protein ACKVUT_15575 [Gaiella sp.]